MANKKIGDILRTLRNEKGYTQQQVADILDLKNKSTLGSWEIGKSEPDAYTLLKLCNIYGVEDIYKAFDEISPITKTDTLSKNALILEKIQKLDDNFKLYLEKQIDLLLELQNQIKK